jgi:hypothetical protein
MGGLTLRYDAAEVEEGCNDVPMAPAGLERR